MFIIHVVMVTLYWCLSVRWSRCSPQRWDGFRFGLGHYHLERAGLPWQPATDWLHHPVTRNRSVSSPCSPSSSLVTCHDVCVCVCVCARVRTYMYGVVSGTHTQIILGKWGIVSKWGWPQLANHLLINLGGSIHAIGCPLALLESSIFSSAPGRKLYLLCSLFFLFFTLFWLDYCISFWGHHMNTHHESGVKLMSPVTLAHLRFPEIHHMYVCMCVCVCVCVCVCDRAATVENHNIVLKEKMSWTLGMWDCKLFALKLEISLFYYLHNLVKYWCNVSALIKCENRSGELNEDPCIC